MERIALVALTAGLITATTAPFWAPWEVSAAALLVVGATWLALSTRDRESPARSGEVRPGP